jgi:hypothetical protein
MMSARALVRRCGAYLALAALTLQVALSFAHVHTHDLAAPRIDHTDRVSIAHVRPGLQVAQQLPARLADDDDHCPICFAGFLLSNASLPAAPENSRSLQFAENGPAFDPLSASVFQPRHPAFLSRAPPIA